MDAPVAAIVLASRGGAGLTRALESVAWAAERIVLDPAGRLDGRPLSPGVARAVEPVQAAHAPWLLLLEEQDVVPAPLAALIADTARAPAALPAYRIGHEVRVLGVTLRPRYAPVHLVRRAGARLTVGVGLGAELRPRHGPVGRLAGRLVTGGVDSLAAAVDALDAEATAIAALLRARGVRPRLWRLAVAPFIPGARALLARDASPDRWGRWTVSVLAGYRAMVAEAKLWELWRAEAARVR